MKLFKLLVIILLLVATSCGKDDASLNPDPKPVQDSIKFIRGGITLHWNTQVKNFNPVIKKNMVETFYKVYPKIIAEYNTGASNVVTFEILPVAKIGDNEYPAYTSGKTITFNANYLINNASDWDIVTHEAVHVMQEGAQYVGWLNEGVADYIRYQYGVHNVTGWRQAFLGEKAQDYKDGYGRTGRFLLWVEKNIKAGTVKALDNELRRGVYKEETTWKTVTGLTLDELGQLYQKSPNANMP